MSASCPRPSLLQRQWNRGGWLSGLLRPLGALTDWAVTRKRAQYRDGRRQAYRPPVPVVIIGNIYVGGTGKTPVVIAAVQALRARGWTPGVVSRGYGTRIGAQPRTGQGELNSAHYGDEPALIAHATSAPVAVHPQRALAAQALLHDYADVDVIVSDDGLQHLALARDVEIVVQDERGIGNGRLLPAGPLREPAARLADVNAIITNLGMPPGPSAPVDVQTGAAPRRIRMWLQPDHARPLRGGAPVPLATFADPAAYPAVAAVAGIGHPARFFATLQAAGISLATTLPLPDHYDYRRSPFAALRADAILITAKDAIKCRTLDDARLWEVPVQACFSDPDLFDWLSAVLRAARAARS